MLTYAAYKNPLTESTPAQSAGEIQKIEDIIDAFVADLKRRMVTTSIPNRRGVFDRLKNWWSNLYHGRYGQSNPYFWTNKLGDDLGTTESFRPMPLPLSHYKILLEQAKLLEESLPAGSENLRVIKIIDNWAQQFKQAIMNLVGQQAAPVAQPEKTAEIPAQTAVPEKEVPPVEEKPAQLSPQQQELMDRLDAVKDKMSPVNYKDMHDKIMSGDESQMGLVDKTLKNRVGTMENPGSVGQEPKPEVTPETDDIAPPKTGNRRWHELSPHERVMWDEAGGGDSHSSSFVLRRNNIKTLPWIVRLGDPRLEEIEKIRGRELLSRLLRQKRIEAPNHPIRNRGELDARVAQAKQLVDAEREQVSADRKTRHQTRLKKQPVVEPEKITIPTVKPKPAQPAKQPPVKPQPPPQSREDKLKALFSNPAEDKPARTASMDLPPVNEPEETKSPIELAAELREKLSSLQGIIDDDEYNKLDRKIQSEEPKKLESAKKIINFHMNRENQSEGNPLDDETEFQNLLRQKMGGF